MVSFRGQGGGFELSLPPSEISLLDIVEAVDGSEPAFRCTEIRRRGPTALSAREYRARCAIHVAMNKADEAWRNELRTTSIADLAHHVLSDASPKALTKGAAWMQEVLA